MVRTPGLRLEGKSDLRPTVRQGLAASLQRGMAVLALPALDLHAELGRLSEENPFLLYDRGARESTAFGAVPEPGRIAAPLRLADVVRDQIAYMELPANVRALAEILAYDLDPRGYLTASSGEIAQDLGVSPHEVDAARAALQACDPAGIGARDLAECIALQLIERGVSFEVSYAVVAQLAAIAENRLQDAADAMSISLSDLEALTAEIRLCSPEPAAGYNTAQLRPLVPELAIERLDGAGLQVRLLDDPAQSISMDETLLRHAKADGSRRARQFARDAQVEAQQILTAIGFRARTLLAVGRAVAEAQSAFFLGKRRAPDTLSRAEIASRIGLHPATVGRAIKGRGVLSSGQVHQMHTLFPTGLSAEAASVSRPEILARLTDLVARETASSVLDDAAIARHLKDDGVDIARRTVAKYRKCLHIPSSSLRRRVLLARGK